MRLTIFLTMMTILNVNASSYGQRITLSANGAGLTQIFDEIRKQTGYDFIITKETLKLAKPITLSLKKASLEETLDRCFNGQPFSYTISDKSVIIKEKEKSIIEQLIARFQEIDVRGKVLDEKGEPLAGATISVKGTAKSVRTNAKGEFNLQNVDQKEKLVITYIGYQTREVNAAADLGSLTMVLADAKLEEVMINAGYYTVKDSERTGNISRITAKDIENQPVTNFLATMQGRMPGVSITQTTGIPGGAFDIKIRGQNSLRFGANNPLFIIDGVPYSAEAIGSGVLSAVLPTQPNPLNSIDPEQIESIEVLKDADATAIYGSRGANGVVLITTKKGKTGKTQLSTKAFLGFGEVTRFMDLMNTEQYLKMRKQAYANDGITTIPTSAYDVNGTWDQTRYTDWQEELLGGTAKTTDVSSSLSGGSAQTQFLLSGHYNKQTSVFHGDHPYQKGTVRLNVNHQSDNKKFNSVLSVGYTLQDNSQPMTDLMRETLKMAPNAPALYTPEGLINWENNTFNNPLRNLNGKYKSQTNDLITSMLLSYQLTNDLQIQSNFGYTTLRNKEKNINPSTRFNPAFGLSGPENSSLMIGDTDRQSWIIEPQLNWKKTFNKHAFNILIGSTFQSQKANQIVQLGSGFPSNSLISNIVSATTVSTYLSDESIYKYQAFFARVNYNLQEKYIVNLTGRRDGSSRFGPNKQFSNFGAAGLAWIFSKENLFENNKTLSFGKLRASYGITGSDHIGDYQYLDTYGSGTKYGGVTGLQPSRLFNPNFSWESNRKMEVALEAGLFADRIFLTSSYYDNRSSNQLTGIPLPGTTGFTSIQSNLKATVQNKGLEFTLRSTNFQNADWNWSTNFNLTSARTKLIAFPNLAGSTYANTLVIGESLNIKKVYHYKGLSPQTGLYTFEDVNSDGQLTSIEDKKTIVDLSPQFYGGLQNTIKYKNWQLDFLFQFVKQKNYNASSYFNIPGSEGNQLASAGYQQNYTSGANSTAFSAYLNYFESDGAITDASYIRLKNVSISYDLPVKTFKCRLFCEGQNLLIFTNYQGADPEFNALGYLPPLKVISAGLQIHY